jgi:hypothetical protein
MCLDEARTVRSNSNSPLAEFEVRVVLHPIGHDPRVAITGMEITPDVAEPVG